MVGFAAAREYLHFFRDPVGCMLRVYREHGAVSALGRPLPLGNRRKLHVLAVGPEYNRQVLGDAATFRTTGQFIRGPKNSAQRRVRFGLTRMTGAQHKQQRSLVMPPFHKKAVQSYHDLMVATAAAVLDDWRPEHCYDMHSEMRKLSLRISSAILFNPDPEQSPSIGRILEEWQRRNFSAPVWLFPLNLPGTPYRRLLRHAEGIEKKFLAMIAKRRENPETRTDVLSLLIQARDEESHTMTDTELVGQSTILFGASFETSASTLTWTLFLLAQHPAVMRDVMDELDSVLGGAPPENSHLSQLPVLERVIRESMRILPPVPFTIRAVMQDTRIGPLEVARGSRALCSHYLTHHMPELYPEPQRFRPERWQSITPTQYEYLPFSAGPRACIGAMFASQLLTTSLAMMLQRFRFRVIPGARIDRDVRITMTPRYGMPMMIFRNDRRFTDSDVCGQIHEMIAFP